MNSQTTIEDVNTTMHSLKEDVSEVITSGLNSLCQHTKPTVDKIQHHSKDFNLESAISLTMILGIYAYSYLVKGGRIFYNLGKRTREAMHQIDDSKIFERAIWEVPMELIDRGVNAALAMPKEEREKMKQSRLDKWLELENQLIADLAIEPEEPEEEAPGQSKDSQLEAPIDNPGTSQSVSNDVPADSPTVTPELTSLGIRQLKTLAKDKGIPNYSRLKKPELIQALIA